MMNPELQRHFGATSHIKRCVNVSEPLHFCFELDGNGRGLMRTKKNARQEQWSEPWYPLKCEKNGLKTPDHEHKLSLGAIEMYVKVHEREV